MAFNVSASVWESDVNVSNNTSIAHVKITITTSGKSYSNYDHYGTIVIDGTSYSHGAYRLPQNTTRTFESTKTITHNDDGSKSINWSYSFPVKSDDTRTGGGTLALTTIARASQPSCITYPNTTQNIGNVGDTIKIHMNRKSTSFKHTVTYTLGSKSGTIATNVTDNCDWTIPLDLANYITNAKSGNGTIYAETFNGSTSIGKKSVGFTVNIPSTATFKPTMSLSVTPSGQFKSKYLNKVSGVTVSATTGGKYNATISSYSISGLSKTASKANLVVNPINENLTNASQSFTISGSVTDSRGYTNTASTSITVYRYNAPQITQYSVQRCTSDGTVSNSGTYAKVGITYKYQNDGYSNTMPTKKININNTDYTLTTTETTSNGVVTGTGYTVVGGGNLAITNKYNYTITCIDEVGKSITSQGVLNTSERIVSIRPQGKGIAFGMFATMDNLVESAWEIKAPKLTVANIESTQETVLRQGFRVTTINAGSGTSGYFNVCSFTINGSYVNQPILFGITQRSRSGEIKIQFSSVNSKEPALSVFTKTGNINAYMYKASASVWNLYIQKSEAHDNLEVTELHKGAYMGNVAIAWVNSIVTSVPSGYITASKQYIATRTILYDSSTGTTGNVTLSQKASNFDYIDIYYNKGTGTNKCARIYNPNGKYVNIDLFLRQDNLFQFQTKRLYINGTSITYTQTGVVNIEGSTFATYTSNEIQIMRVEGWA